MPCQMWTWASIEARSKPHGVNAAQSSPASPERALTGALGQRCARRGRQVGIGEQRLVRRRVVNRGCRRAAAAVPARTRTTARHRLAGGPRRRTSRSGVGRGPRGEEDDAYRPDRRGAATCGLPVRVRRRWSSRGRRGSLLTLAAVASIDDVVGPLRHCPPRWWRALDSPYPGRSGAMTRQAELLEQRIVEGQLEPRRSRRRGWPRAAGPTPRGELAPRQGSPVVEAQGVFGDGHWSFNLLDDRSAGERRTVRRRRSTRGRRPAMPSRCAGRAPGNIA